jgi:hypothetical protein
VAHRYIVLIVVVSAGCEALPGDLLSDCLASDYFFAFNIIEMIFMILLAICESSSWR